MVRNILVLLRGRALTWAEAVNVSSPFSAMTLGEFDAMIQEVFDQPDHCGDAASRLLDLQQGSRSVDDYSVEFGTLAADTSWTVLAALREVYRKGINERIMRVGF